MTDPVPNPIAIIGASARLPDADSLDAFWDLLQRNEDAVTEVGPERWDRGAFFDADQNAPGKTYCTKAGFLSGIDEFDAPFFGLEAADARKMDPQQRLALQEAWRAFEDAGYTPDRLRGRRVGVFVGARTGDYHDAMLDRPEDLEPQALMGHDTSVLSARISYFLNLNGPNLTVNTACSSMGVALHLAMQSLRSGEIDLALVGGVHVMSTAQRFLMHSRSRLLSKTGACRPFDAAADGFVLGEAVGFVVLKPRAAAVAERDWIYGNILATGVNHSGFVEKGLAAPNPEAQVALIREVLAKAAVPAESIGYVEAHGTGTYKGDAIEANALREAYGVDGGVDQPRAKFVIGSVKANVGHSLTAAVLPGLLKILLSFRHRKLVRQLYFESPNELLRIEDAPFKVQTETADWVSAPGQPRRAALGAISYSGTNFHVILEEEVPPAPASPATGPTLIPLSAKTPMELSEQVRQLEAWLTRHQTDASLADVARTLGSGRAHWSCRVAFVAADTADCLRQLRAWRSEEVSSVRADAPALPPLPAPAIAELATQAHRGSSAAWQELATLYRRGTDLPWDRLAAASSRFIPLPAYPFARHRYWLRSNRETAGTEVAVTLFLSRRDDVYQSFLAARAGQADVSRAAVQVKYGDGGFRRLGAAIYQVDPRDEEELRKLTESIGSIAGKRVQIVHLWNYECEALDFSYHGDIERCLHHVERSLDTGVRALSTLTRLLTQVGGCASVDVLSLYHGYQPQNGMSSGWWDDEAAGTATSFRAVRIPDRAATPTDVAALLARELDQVSPGRCSDVAYEDARAERPVARASAATTAAGGIQLRRDGTYLLDIGGETGGWAFAEAWRRQGAGRLVVLVSPDRQVEARSRFGRDVVVVASALSGAADLDRVRAELAQNGVVALHGVVRLTATSDARAFARNVRETLLLDDLTQECPLEFFVLLQVGTARQTGALRFADAFTELRNRMADQGQRRGRTLRMRFALATNADAHAAFLAVFGTASPATVPVPGPALPTDSALETRFKRIVSDVLKVPATAVDLSASLESLRFDSMRAVDVVDRLQRVVATNLRPSVFYQHKTLRGVLDAWLTLAAPATGAAGEAPQPAVRTNADGDRTAEIRRDGGPEPIAIVGMSGRFPMAKDLDEFWANLRDGRDCVREVPADRTDLRNTSASSAGGELSAPKWAGFIDGIDRFDPQFFGISTREAELMDPQQRLFLECAWHAIEDAGYDPTGLAGTPTGVFVGVATCDYASILEAAQQQRQAHSPIGWFHSILANRLSYLLDLRGPSQPIDTACSSSLVALHRAVQSIRSGQCTQAIVGGVNALLTAPLFDAFLQAGMLSPEGRCRTFDAGANGYVRGEGVGVLFLKPLSRALADGDAIHAVIRGSAEGHGGRATSLTAPSSQSQADVLAQAYREAGIDPRSIGYIEAHGTGTALGDPIEVDGLKLAFAASRAGGADAVGFCGLGSVKTNIGHLEAAAGIAGIIKVVLAMRHRTLPGNLHFAKRNPYLALDGSPFFVVEKTQPWPAVKDGRGGAAPRRAGVSSFGFGGVNAHVVIEEYVAPAASSRPEHDQVIVLSAKTSDRLQATAANLLQFVRTARANGSPLNLADLAYTLQVGRAALDERLGFRVNSIAELEAALVEFLDGRELAGLRRGRAEPNDATIALFADDETLRDAVRQWLQQGKWDRLLELWVKGLRIDWRLAHGEDRPTRIHLPTYPFADERYWVEPATRRHDVAVVTAEIRPTLETSERRLGLLQKQWVSCPPPAAVRVEGPVLILTTSATLALAEQVRARLAAGEILVLGPSDAVPSRAWSAYAGWIDLVGCADELPAGLRWLTPVQRMVEEAAASRPIALGVTRALESFDNPAVQAAGALHAALYRLLPNEYAAVRSHHLDLAAQTNDETAAGQIVAEFGASSEDSTVCYRGAMRYRAVLREAALPVASQSAAFPADRVLWITGGTRGLGALCARHFAERHGAKKLVLTGREALPPREQWAECEQNGGPAAEKIRAVRALEAQGVDVRVFALDLTDLGAVQRCRDAVTREMGPIGGLLHCAGVLDDENPAFVRKTIPGIARVFAPKVAGTRCLLDALAEAPLAFAVLFSSVSAIVPQLGAGLADYAMANAFLDATAEARARRLPIVSVRWPSWRETGMGEVKNGAYAETGLLSLTNAEGLRCLDAILAGKSRSIVMPVVFDPRRWSPETLLRHRARNAVAAAAIATMATPDATPAEATRVWLTDLFAQELKMPVARLKADTPFQEYGMDSILLAQAWKQINRKLGTNLDPSAVFEYPTLRALASWLARTQGAAVTPLQSAQGGPTQAPASSVRAAESSASTSTTAKPTERREPVEIAVVGMSCRFPGAENLAAYWHLLSEGRTAIARVPESRWGNPEGFAAGLMENVTEFDPEYFLLSAEDARAMDPQALLVLEEALHLFHHAGYTAEEVKGGATGVYLGARAPAPADSNAVAESRNPILAVGQNYLAANVSRFFDLHGPSLVVDTACSSALVGMNLAIQALRSGEIDSAVVGGVSLLASDAVHRLFRQRNLLSRDGAFHLFDARASGVVLGEGVGLVLLKTLERARADGDRIYAVVKGLAVNNDGRSAGPATPNLLAQKAVMQSALGRSGVRAADVDYLEANGSGSEVTDLLELKAIDSIYGGSRSTRCALGSIKPNIGHPLCAEGIASFIKVVLMLERREQPPFLSGERPIAHFDLGASAFAFRRERTAWSGRACLAALNCFADGGTNVHAILAGFDGDDTQTVRRAPIAPPALRRRNVRQTVSNPWTRAIDAAHPFVGNHQAYGQPLLPGLAYLDILYQHLRDVGLGGTGWELANVSLHHPLTVRPAHELRVAITDERDGDRCKLRIEGTEFAADGSAGAKTIFVTAEALRGAPPAFAETLEIDAIRSAATKTALSSAYAHFEAKGLVHSGPVKAQGELYTTDDAVIVELSLPPEARAEAAAYLFHPTLIDGAAVGAGPMFAGLVAGEDRLFLPLFFGRFRAAAPLRERCFARVRKATLRRKNELLYSDMEFFDAAGVKVAELTDFAYKLVRDAGLIQTSPGSDRTFAPTAQSTIVTVLDGATAQTSDRTLGAAAELLRIVIGSKLKRAAHEVDLRRGYYEMGLDSSMLLDVVATLGRRLAVSLSPTLLFEHATPAELAAHLEHAYATELARMPDAAPIEPAAAGPNLVVRAFRLETPVRLTEADRVAAEALVAELLADRLALWVDGGELQVRAPRERLTPALGEKIATQACRIAKIIGDRKYLPLTRSQKRYWVLSTLQPEKSAYNNPIGMRLRGKVDLARLREAFRVLLNSHHVLRATFPRKAKLPVMEIAPPVSEAPCRITRLDAASADAREQALRDLATQESRTPINPAVGPTVRIHLIEAAPDDVTILLTAHHAVFDGYSYLPVMSELLRIYRALVQRVTPATDGLVQYENYALSERPEGDSRSRGFWQEHLHGAPASVALPLDRERAAINAGHGDTRSIWIDADAYRSANTTIQEQRVTLFAFMVSLLNVALAGWSNQTDLVVGTTVQCRDNDADQQVIGDFTNFIPIRTRTRADDTFAALVQQVYRTSLLCLEHKHFPFDELVALASPAARNINPVYNILVNQLPSITEMETRLSDAALRVAVSNNRLLNGSAMLDLRFEWYEENGGLRFICEYNTDLFRDATIEAFLGRIEHALRARTYVGAAVANLMPHFRANATAPSPAAAISAPTPTTPVTSADDLEAFVIAKVLAVKNVPAIHGMRDVNFFELGLGSFDVANLSAELEPHYPSFVVGDLFKYPTIRALAAHLRAMTPVGTPSESSGEAAPEGLIDFEFFRT